ncbi:hypothetical protein HR060_11530 [Catenovulum sp. SM1970]|uniref:hypothetical protein n=1 Tax=Marinifaba aquimaris TaxID=2741323 RepID=UPI001572468A|nr:hypothetical protein [Marinifaba aquimaris]NTS77493.1 hypothetical protein [Marinifaba aquimaris]
MNQENVISILEGLANGLNPVTGEILPSNSPYNEPEVIRALFQAINLIPKARKPKKTIQQKQQENIEKGLPQNYGLPWEEADVQKVVSMYQSEISIPNIANEFSRKPGSIVSLLKRHGVITEEVSIVLSTAFK